jgi:hypothetical protein
MVSVSLVPIWLGVDASSSASNLRKNGVLAIIMKQAYQFACGHNVVKLK